MYQNARSRLRVPTRLAFVSIHQLIYFYIKELQPDNEYSNLESTVIDQSQTDFKRCTWGFLDWKPHRKKSMGWPRKTRRMFAQEEAKTGAWSWAKMKRFAQKMREMEDHRLGPIFQQDSRVKVSHVMTCEFLKGYLFFFNMKSFEIHSSFNYPLTVNLKLLCCGNQSY